ncbi:hypothetical protein [Haloferula sargassicola]|uniref:Uncharacterized protein n=1 Tax=Haloferula sargassicola TaxID=490096 RepID=A0ABP9UMP1_9BACT
MNSSLLATALGPLPMLVAYWVAVIFFGKSRKDPAWACMMVGVVMTTLSIFGWPVLIYVMDRGGGPRPWIIGLAQGVSMLGSLLLAAGIAMRAVKLSRGSDRVRELELIIEAQNDELARQQRGA